MSPEILQTLGILAIGLGFVLIGLGGFSTYHASQKLQHAAELREVEEKGQYQARIIELMLRNQQLQQKSVTAGPAPQVSPPPPPPSAPTPPQAQAPAVSPAPRSPVEQPEAAPNHPSPRPGVEEEAQALRPEASGKHLTAQQRHIIRDALRAHGRHTVKIESSYGDEDSRAYATELAEAFASADWLVRGIDAHRGLPLPSGVTVSAGSFPPLRETRVVYEALLSAGVAVTQHLNPKQHSSETLILVGAPL